MTSEPAIKANSSEAHQFYQRGLAAARGGQKRVAEGLLIRAVRLDPQHERAWLWLSAVVEDPQQQAFCLEAVLGINPNNEPAQRGLRTLKEQKLLVGAAKPITGLSQPPADGAKPLHNDHQESWWITWRRRRRDISRARLLIWLFPLMLVGLAMGLNSMVAIAITPTAAPATVIAEPVAALSAPPTPTMVSILEAEPISVIEGLTISYLEAIAPLRTTLRDATLAYRNATSQPGGSVGYVVSTQHLYAVVQRAISDLDKLRPPRTLQQAHNDYRRGLELELEGLGAVLEFYSGYDVANANHAAQRFQEARAYIERATITFNAHSQHMAQLSSIGPNTAR
ncbi:hypothetical protein [Candidatus Oscillochloris fontis]|uniref:hypothetical protein n=1 Tax=Candidatus Oscillochloris fontis TaxID=2496868 RepID=UPI00101D224E|nr:hypothetical protein [Candidatus Oscillochloris fontis]